MPRNTADVPRGSPVAHCSPKSVLGRARGFRGDPRPSPARPASRALRAKGRGVGPLPVLAAALPGGRRLVVVAGFFFLVTKNLVPGVNPAV